jgi:hypothetical protein
MRSMADAWRQEHRAREDERAANSVALGGPARLC